MPVHMYLSIFDILIRDPVAGFVIVSVVFMSFHVTWNNELIKLIPHLFVTLIGTLSRMSSVRGNMSFASLSNDLNMTTIMLNKLNNIQNK